MRVWVNYKEWEGVSSGFFDPPGGWDKEACELEYAEFLSDLELFDTAMHEMIGAWPRMTAHFLSNTSMNRVAFLGQASMNYCTGVPACFRSGFKRLTDEGQALANEAAERVAASWRNPYTAQCSKSARIRNVKGTHARIAEYLRAWSNRGYAEGIPDDLPAGLEKYAPSYRQIAVALLKNDMHLTSLGFSAPVSPWYGAIKREEIKRRNNDRPERN